MRSSISIVLGSLLALAAAEGTNPFNVPNGGYKFKAGEPTTLKWNPTSDGTISLKLQSGEVLTPDGGTTIASNIDNSGSYEWTPPKDIMNQSDYTIEIIDDEDPDESNYMPRFSVSGATATASPSATGSSSASASSSSVSTTTDSSSTASASTMTTMTSTTGSSSSSATGASSTSASGSSSATVSGSTATGKSASGSADASSTSPSGAAQTGSDTSAGMVNQVSGGMMAVVLGAMALM